MMMRRRAAPALGGRLRVLLDGRDGREQHRPRRRRQRLAAALGRRDGGAAVPRAE